MSNLCPLEVHKTAGTASQHISTSPCSLHAAQQQQQSLHRLQPAQIKGYLTFRRQDFSLLGLNYFLTQYFKSVITIMGLGLPLVN